MRREMMTEEQQNTLNAACGDLATQIIWHGWRLSKDDWRHFLSGMVLGWRRIPAYDKGEGPPGFVMLGGSSKKLTKEEASLAIEMAFHIGDEPKSQNLDCPRVRWCRAVVMARYIIKEPDAA